MASLTISRRLGDHARGQITVLVAGGILVLLACAALAVDLGNLRHLREKMQTAADSAAIAAVEGMATDQWSTDAQRDATRNGFNDGSNGVSVSVYHPPQSGTYTNNFDYFQVVISEPGPTYFLRAIGIDSIGVSASATAHMGNSPNCIYVLDPQASAALGTLTASGGANLNATCGIIVDSASSSGITVNGGTSIITATTIGVVGGYSLTGGAIINPPPSTGIVPADDPLNYVPQPTVPTTCDHTGTYTPTSNLLGYATMNPGTYCGGVQINAGQSVSMNQGLYIMSGGGFTLNGGASLSGSGVTIFNSQGNGYAYKPIIINGGGTINLSAPTSTPLKGILFFQDRSISDTSQGSTIAGGAGATYNGALYFPAAQLTYTGGSTTSQNYTILVADVLKIDGASNLGNDYSSLQDGSPIKAATLAE